MPFYLCWGLTFLAIFDEFTPAQIADILAHANQLFDRRPQDDELRRLYGIDVSPIPFERFGYGLVLRLTQDVWAIERATFPPHALPGERILKARRRRERAERKAIKAILRIAQALLAAVQAAKDDECDESRKAKKRRAKGTRGIQKKSVKAAKTSGAAKPKQQKTKPKGDAAKRTISTVFGWALVTYSMLYNIGGQAYEKLSRLSDKITSWLRSMDEAASASTIGQRVLDLITPTHEECRESNIAAWVEKPLPLGYQRERRLFFADFLPIWLDTIGPIETMFVRGGQSVFGELFAERACVA